MSAGEARAAGRAVALRRRIVGSAVALAVTAALAGGIYAWAKTRRTPAVEYQTATIDRGRVAAKATASGTLSALVTVLVGSQVSGRLESIRVDFNSTVKKGQVVATIEPSLLRAAVEQAGANAAAARANVAKAKAQAEDADRQQRRAADLVAQKLIAQAEFDTADAAAKVARATVAATIASVAQSEASLHQAEVNLRYATIVSPIDGTVISRSVDVGQTVAASLQAPTLFTIAQDLTKMQVDTNVAEADVGKVRAGMPVTFSVDAYPSEKFAGVVRQVRDAAQTIQNVVTYDAVIDVDNAERRLKPGMTATVTFVYAERADALRVPNAAIRFRPDATALAAMSGKPSAGGRPPASPPGKKPVWVMRDGKPSTLLLTVGVTDGVMTEITGGELREGDTVITEAIASASSARPTL